MGFILNICEIILTRCEIILTCCEIILICIISSDVILSNYATILLNI